MAKKTARSVFRSAWSAFLVYLAAAALLLMLPEGMTNCIASARDALLWPVDRVARAGMRLARGARSRPASAEETAALRERVVASEAELVKTREELRQALQRLQQYGRLPATERGKVILAEVLGLDPSPVKESARLDRGTKDGVMRLAAVLWNGALVGRIDEASPKAASTSKAILLSHSDCRVAVRCERTRVVGEARGIGGGLCEVRYVAFNKDVKVGDLFITSGADGLIPAGIPVGKCITASGDSGASLMRIELEPIVDLSCLEEVTILVPEEVAP